MAYIPKSPYDALLGNQQVAGASQDGGGTSATPAPAAAGGASAPSTGSGQFVNFQRVLDANKGQGAKMAGQLVDNVDQQAGAAKGSLEQLQNQYKTATQAATVGFAPPTDPPMFAGDSPYTPQGQEAAIKTTLSGYTGPTSIAQNYSQGLQATTKRFTDASDAAKALRTGTGVQASLQKLHGAGGYSAGNSRFDSLLAQGEGGGQLHNAAQRYSNLSSFLDQGVADTSATAAGVSASEAARQQAQQYLNDAKTWDQTETKRTAVDEAKDQDAEVKEQIERRRNPYGRMP